MALIPLTLQKWHHGPYSWGKLKAREIGGSQSHGTREQQSWGVTSGLLLSKVVSHHISVDEEGKKGQRNSKKCPQGCFWHSSSMWSYQLELDTWVVFDQLMALVTRAWIVREEIGEGNSVSPDTHHSIERFQTLPASVTCMKDLQEGCCVFKAPSEYLWKLMTLKDVAFQI